MDFACNLLGSNARSTDADLAQLLVIVSDGRGVSSEGEAAVRTAVRKAKHQQIFMVFVIIDNPDSKVRIHLYNFWSSRNVFSSVLSIYIFVQYTYIMFFF